ncbi:MAG TPA: diguanylate cyclase [Xanthomonadales bacterium]|nr:diguanylate cyclase [Xanthomonadales bacterium]
MTARYTAEHYPAAPTNLAVVGDPRGMVWAGNTDGLLRFAGGRWSLVTLPGRSPARAMAIGPDGALYVGGYDRIGRVEELPTGEVGYLDLYARFGLDREHAALGNVWDVLSTPDGVWFRAERRMFRLGIDGKAESWPLPATLRGVHVIGRDIYARLDGEGLARFRDGRFEPMPGGERFAKRPFNAAFAAPGDALLLLSADGFYRADAHGIERVPTPHDALLAEREPYTAVRLPDGGYAIGTISGHVLHFGPTLALIGDYPIDPYAVIAMGLDREGGVWVATEGGLARLSMPSPWTVFGAGEGLRGQLSDAVWYDDAMFVASSAGLFRADPAVQPIRFVRAPLPDAEVWDLEPTPAGMLVAARDGAYIHRDGELARISAQPDVYWVRRSQHRPEEAYALAENVLLVLRLEAGQYVERGRVELGATSASSFVERADGELWIGDSRAGPIELSLAADGSGATAQQRHDAGSGLAIDPEHGSLVFELDRRLHVASGTSYAEYDGERFAASDAHGLAPLIERPMETTIRNSPGGTYALTSRQLLHRARGAQRWEPVYLETTAARGFVDLNAEPSGVLRLITWGGILQHDPHVAELPKPELVASLRRVEAIAPDGGSVALPIAPAAAVEVPSGHALRFGFELLSADPGREFRYRVVGVEDEWRPWGVESELALAAMRAGDYRLELEARSKGGRAARPLSYAFRVAPAWYEQRGWQALAAALGVLALLAIGRFYALRRVARIEQRNRRLEQTIGERTRELERANAQLARLATLDGLTAVPNRRGFDAFLDEQWTLCRGAAQPLTLLMIDVDHFKQFNDRHGHLAGDEALRGVALELARFASGEREMLARFGGEEFAMVLSGATLEAGIERASYVRDHFAERAERDGLTLSIGVASCVPELGIPPRQLIDLADAALYLAKRNGRNRVEAQRAA